MNNPLSPDVLFRELAEEQHGAGTLEQAKSCGFTESTLSRRCHDRLLSRVMTGAYAVPELVDEWTTEAAACLTIRDGVLFRLAGARFWQFDGLDAWKLELAVPRPHGPQRRWLHRCTDLAPFEIEKHGIVRVTEATRTLIDYCGVVDVDRAERALEGVLRRGLTTIPRIEWRLQGLTRPGRMGPATLRAALERRPLGAPATGSDAETLLIQVMRAAGLPEPSRQHKVRHRAGAAYIDLAYPYARIAIEIDGYQSHGNRGAFQRDRSRQNEIVLSGWKVLRFTWTDITTRPSWVVDCIRRALHTAAA